MADSLAAIPPVGTMAGMNAVAARIAENHTAVRRRIVAACEECGRDPAAVRLVAVTKYAAREWVQALVGLGVVDLGEGRPQQLVERAAWFGPPVRWHLIGPLQRNKARKVLPLATCIHSVDSLRLLGRLDELAEELALRPRLLLEVNIAAEEQKHGFAPDELEAAWNDALRCRHVEIAGLMTMAPHDAPADITRGVFRSLRALRDRLAARPDSLPLPELSMGMSDDFETAITEGATMVRVGSRLFEGLENCPSVVEC